MKFACVSAKDPLLNNLSRKGKIMRMREFIRQNRAEIDSIVDAQLGNMPASAGCYCPLSGTDHKHQPDRRNDKERKLWVQNDEGLSCWARREGVSV